MEENRILKPGNNWAVPTGKLKDSLNRGDAFGTTIAANTGYCNLCFSPAATANATPENKLGVVLTFQEWRAIGALISAERQIPWSSWVTARFVDFLLEAIDSIPDPEVAKALELTLSAETDFV
jgi:hypothetical protein